MIKPSLDKITGPGGELGGMPQHFVYVHGIRSEPNTFDKLRKHLEQEAGRRGVPVAHYGFRYPYQDNMQNNGSALAKQLAEINANPRSVTLFGHSMGGLISRLAILSANSQAYKLVKRVIMFGTPNHGAVTGASLNHLLLSILHSTAKGIVGFFHTGAGVLELTEVHKVFAAPLQRRQQADGIEYVTVPGTCFNESRHRLDFGDIHPMARALGIMNLLMRRAYSISVPNDGIVERKSVDLFPAGPGRRSEKRGSHTTLADSAIEYVHIHLLACDRLDHLTVHTDKEVLEFVAELAFRQRLHDLLGTEFERDVWPFY